MRRFAASFFACLTVTLTVSRIGVRDDQSRNALLFTARSLLSMRLVVRTRSALQPLRFTVTSIFESQYLEYTHPHSPSPGALIVSLFDRPGDLFLFAACPYWDCQYARAPVCGREAQLPSCSATMATLSGTARFAIPISRQTTHCQLVQSQFHTWKAAYDGSPPPIQSVIQPCARTCSYSR